MGSLITTFFGLLSAAGAVLVAVGEPEIGGILVAIGTGGVGTAARDNNKSSESVGAK